MYPKMLRLLQGGAIAVLLCLLCQRAGGSRGHADIIVDAEDHQTQNEGNNTFISKTRELFFASRGGGRTRQRIRGGGQQDRNRGGSRSKSARGEELQTSTIFRGTNIARGRVQARNRNRPARAGLRNDTQVITTQDSPATAQTTATVRPPWIPFRSNPNLPSRTGPSRSGTRNPVPVFDGRIPEFIFLRRNFIIRQRRRFQPDRVIGMGNMFPRTPTASPMADSDSGGNAITPTFGPAVTIAPTTAATLSAITMPPAAAGVTVSPTVGATTISPTSAALTSAPTMIATTLAPTAAAATSAPTIAPTAGTTIAPTAAGVTITPTVGATTIAPTPTTGAPTATTIAPTAATETIAPTVGATTVAPTAVTETIAPTVGATTIAPTSVGVTIAPTVGATTTAPTTATATAAPSTVTAVPTAATETIAPTMGATTIAPTTVGVTIAPTVGTTTIAPTAVMETVAPTGAAAVTAAPTTATAGTTTAPTTTAECTDNPQDIQIGVDLQLVFPDEFFAACDEEEENLVLETIQTTLNTAFPTVVTDWEGTADFGAIELDGQQFVDNADPFARDGFRRFQSASSTPQNVLQQSPRTTRGNDRGIPSLSEFKSIYSSQANAATTNVENDPPRSPSAQLKLRRFNPSQVSHQSEYSILAQYQADSIPSKTTQTEFSTLHSQPVAQKMPVHHLSHPNTRHVAGGGQNRQRNLQQDTCPTRPTDCPESASACLFGCGIAATTNCGSGSTDNWVNLGDEIGTALGALNLECMGFPDDPTVVVNVF